MKLIRKVSLAKWKKSLERGEGYISGDALTACLRTGDNTLSVWKWEGEEEYACSLLALLASQTKIDKIDIINIDPGELQRRSLVLDGSIPGNTAARVYAGNHFDIIDLDHTSLKEVAEMVLAEVESDRQIRITAPKFKEILIKGVKSGEVQFSLLHESVRQSLEGDLPEELKK